MYVTLAEDGNLVFEPTDDLEKQQLALIGNTIEKETGTKSPRFFQNSHIGVSIEIPLDPSLRSEAS